MKLDEFLSGMGDAREAGYSELVDYLQQRGFHSGFPILIKEGIERLAELIRSRGRFGDSREIDPGFLELAPTYAFFLRRKDKRPWLKLRRRSLDYELTNGGQVTTPGAMEHINNQIKNYPSVLIVVEESKSGGMHETRKTYLRFLEDIAKCANFLREHNLPFCISHLKPEPFYWPDSLTEETNNPAQEAGEQ
jgi:hypothetical protein